MAGDIHHLQIRTNYKIREKIKKLALTHHRSTADIVRTALELGLRLLEKLLEVQSDMVTDYIRLLKKESRLKSENKK
jgi:hypothetical protein